MILKNKPFNIKTGKNIMLMDLKLNNVNLFGDLMKFLMVGCS